MRLKQTIRDIQYYTTPTGVPLKSLVAVCTNFLLLLALVFAASYLAWAWLFPGSIAVRLAVAMIILFCAVYALLMGRRLRRAREDHAREAAERLLQESLPGLSAPRLMERWIQLLCCVQGMDQNTIRRLPRHQSVVRYKRDGQTELAALWDERSSQPFPAFCRTVARSAKNAGAERAFLFTVLPEARVPSHEEEDVPIAVVALESFASYLVQAGFRPSEEQIAGRMRQDHESRRHDARSAWRAASSARAGRLLPAALALLAAGFLFRAWSLLYWALAALCAIRLVWVLWAAPRGEKERKRRASDAQLTVTAWEER